MRQELERRKQREKENEALRNEAKAGTNVSSESNQSVDYTNILVSEEEKRLYQTERLLMQLILRYGDQSIEYKDENGESCSCSIVGCILKELANNDITIKTPIYKEMLSDWLLNVQEKSISPSQYYLNSPQEAFSQEASHLLSDKYMPLEGKTENEIMSYSEVLHVLNDYRNVLIDISLKRIMEQLSDDSIKQDPEKCMQLLREQMQLNKKKKDLLKGGRVLT